MKQSVLSSSLRLCAVAAAFALAPTLAFAQAGKPQYGGKLEIGSVYVTISALSWDPADFNWKNPVSSSAAIGDNWTPTGPPGNSDTANFNLSSAGYIVDVGTRKVGQLKISNDTLTLVGSSLTAIEPASTLPSIASNPLAATRTPCSS